MKSFIFGALLSVFLALPVFAQTPGVGTDIGGAVGYSRNFIRFDGNTEVLANPSPGLRFVVGFDEVVDPVTFEITKAASKGMEFSTDFVADKDILVTRLGVKGFTDRLIPNIRLIAGGLIGFVDPGEDGGVALIGEQTNLLGLSAALRFDANGLPAEFGGSYAWSYSGVEEVDVSEVHLGLVGTF